MSYQTVWFLTPVHMTTSFTGYSRSYIIWKSTKYFNWTFGEYFWWRHWSIHFTCHSTFLHQEYIFMKTFPNSLLPHTSCLYHHDSNSVNTWENYRFPPPQIKSTLQPSRLRASIKKYRWGMAFFQLNTASWLWWNWYLRPFKMWACPTLILASS